MFKIQNKNSNSRNVCRVRYEKVGVVGSTYPKNKCLKYSYFCFSVFVARYGCSRGCSYISFPCVCEIKMTTISANWCSLKFEFCVTMMEIEK